jgi:hypothetical protein
VVASRIGGRIMIGFVGILFILIPEPLIVL